MIHDVEVRIVTEEELLDWGFSPRATKEILDRQSKQHPGAKPGSVIKVYTPEDKINWRKQPL